MFFFKSIAAAKFCSHVVLRHVTSCFVSYHGWQLARVAYILIHTFYRTDANHNKEVFKTHYTLLIVNLNNLFMLKLINVTCCGILIIKVSIASFRQYFA